MDIWVNSAGSRERKSTTADEGLGEIMRDRRGGVRRDLRNEGMRSFRGSSRVRRIVAAKDEDADAIGSKISALAHVLSLFEGSPL